MGKKNETYEFENPDMLIRMTYVQVLCSKHCTLKLVSNPPPHPGPEPSADEGAQIKKAWRKRANRFSLFYLMLFRPETDLYSSEQTVNDYEYTWPAFVDFVEYLKRDEDVPANKATDIDRMRYEMMLKFFHGWR